ncbi:MAG: amino acid adenylation domain-containing protein [Bacteroidota bacterium]
MELLNLFKKANKKGIKLALRNGKLSVKSNAAIDPELLLEIKTNKDAIVAYLEKYDKKNIAAELLEKYQHEDTNKDLLEKIVPTTENRPEQIPLSFGQERLWFLDQLQGSLEYHLPFAYSFSGNLDKQALATSLQQVVERHEILRTVIYSIEGVGYQKVLSADQWELSFKNLSKNDASLTADIKSFLSAPFDLSSDYMFRACLYQTGDNQHVLAGVFHHISSDGWSQGILLREFMTLYHAHVSKEEIALPQLPLQYIDYALWQRNYLEGAVIDKQLSYWEHKLEDVSALQIPTDHARPTVQSVAGANFSFELNKQLSTDINSLSKKEGVTVFMTLLSAFKILLSRYSGQEDICVGTPIANRTQRELEGMIGFFVNTLALRTEVKNDVSFQELLQSVKQTTLEAYDHQQIPFENIVERVVKTRDMSMTPLFQTMFILQNIPDVAQTEMDGITLSRHEEQGQITSKFDITVTLRETNNRFTVDVNYCTDLFEEDTIQRMFSHYRELLAAIVKTPSARLAELSTIQKSEKQQLLEAFNDTAQSYPKDQTLVDLFETQAAKSPKATAIVFEGESLTYQQLNERSNQLAGFLSKQGIGPDKLVGISINRSLEMLIGILGILKSGGAYVPIDPEYPQDRIDYMLEDSGVSVILTSGDCVESFSGKDQLEIVLLDQEWGKKIGNQSVNNLSRIATPENLAYVIYTSGSTGKPKGVMNSHKGILNQLLWTKDTYGLTSEDVVLQKTTFSFDVSVWEILWPVISGAKLVFTRPGGQADVYYLKGLIESEQVTTIHFVPSMLGVFLAGSSIGESNSLRRVICSGEALTVEQVRSFRELFPTVRFDNLYGPTEASVHVTIWSAPEDVSSLTRVPIGRPVANTSLYVLDSSDNIVPIGVIGELCVGGDQVAKGYLNRSDLTKEKFVANPFKAGDRLYRTGDLARWLPDGTVEYLGRMDTQVKVRGYRIELGEIENALSLLPKVSQCSVLAKEDSGGDKRLIAYVVPEEELENDWKAILKASLGEVLPDYMVPQLWVQLDEMPLTANGKLDRKALPDLDGTLLSDVEYVAPETELEIQLAEIWQELLSVERVGIHDNFFELGGHSLLTVRLIAKIGDIGFQVDVSDVFAYPTISSVIPRLTSAADIYQVPENGIEAGCEYITPEMVNLVDLNKEELEKIMDQIPAANIQDIYPLSPLQKGFYFHHLMIDRTKGDPYVLFNSLSFTSSAKRSEFIEGLKFVINRHDVLRTCVLSKELSQPVQVVLREVNLPIEEIAIDSNQDIFAQVEAETEADKLWIDPSSAPMLQVRVADDPDNDKYYLILNHHHLIMDHIGLEKVKQEIFLFVSGKADLLPPPALYRNFIGDTLREEKLEASQQYFSALYKDISEPTYPFSFTDNQVDGSTQIVSSSVVLPPELRENIRTISGNLQMSPAVFFYAAFGLVIGRCSSKDYALFGSIFLGRLQGSKGSESSLGLFMNTLPVLLDLTGDASTYLARTNEHLQKLIDFEQTPLSEVQDWSGISNDVPMFSTLLNYRHSRKEVSSDDTFDIGAEFVATGSRNNFPFNFDVDDLGDDFVLTAKISDIGIDPSAVVSYVIEALTVLLKEIRNDASSQQLANLSIVPAEEQYQLLELFNETSISLPFGDETVVELFETQVAKTPDASAVVYEGNSLNYQQLNDRSNQLARYLKSQRVTSDMLVGVCIDRSLEMMIAILGIMKASGAYVPIDPEYPQDRRNYMLEDSGVSILLTDSQNSAEFSAREGLEVIALDKDWSKLFGSRSVNNLKRVASPSNLAYVIYTSGSTGKPKGVQITHRNLVDYFYGLVDQTNVQSCDSFGLSSSIATDLGNTVVYASLLTGGRLHVLSEDELISAEKMSKLDIDCLKMVPSHWKTLQTKEAVFVPNKCLILGGEAFTDDVLDILTSNEVGCDVYNHYGPTETTIGKLIHKVSLTEKYTHSVPLGAPFGNNSVYVLNDHNMLCPIGVVGELCIGGAGVAKGYLNRESLTAEKFVNNPFKSEERIYKTGDLARWLSDGTIAFIGRKDNQIKIRGYRVELDEIENALTSISGVDNGCVLAKADEYGDKSLVGYVVIDGDFNKENLQDQLLQSLPEYMVPQLWVELEEMPLTNNGKIDRKSLPEPDSTGLSSKEYVAPRNEAEEQLVEIWQDLLKVEQVGIYDNFFELGGQSLLAIRLIARIQKLGYTVNIKDFYADPNIALLSTKLTSAESGYQVPKNGIIAGCTYLTPSMVTLVDLSQEEIEKIMDHVPGGGANIQDIYPLSPLQEGIYFHHLISDAERGDPYVFPRLFPFPSAEQRSQFIEALGFVVERHDVLRTCVLNEGYSQALQVVLRQVDLPVEEIEIDNSEEFLPQVQKEVIPNNLYMDLTTAPMLRLKVADDVANGQYYLVIHHHHIMIDHIGMAKVREEIGYYLSGQAALLPTPSLYRDYIGDTLNKEKQKESQNYFTKLYTGVDTPTYPFNLSDTKVDGSSSLVGSQIMLSPELKDGIRRISGDLQMSPAVFFHAAFGLVVGRCSNADHAIFGSVLLGRLQGSKGSDSSLGLFMNTLPILLDLKGDVAAYIKHVDERLKELLNHEQIPLSKVHQWSEVSNEVPLFSALLNYRHTTPVAGQEQTIDPKAKLPANRQRTNYPFNLEVDDHGDDFKLTVILSEIGIEPFAVMSYVEESLRLLVSHFDKESSAGDFTTITVDEVSVVSETEKQELLEVFNDTKVNYPEDQTFVDLFEKQTKKTPESVAIVFEGETLTYQQLNERSNQLASYLGSRGVESDVLVGMCFDRSIEMIVGILGVLKSGGAFVPIDPQYPQGRIEYMLEDSGVQVVLSTADCAESLQGANHLDVILLDSEWTQKISKRSVRNLKRVATTTDLAYMIYTSGSTGKPKGVEIPHASLMNFLMATVDRLEMSEMEMFLSVTTYTFDIFYLELFTPLMTGAKVAMLDASTIRDGASLKEAIFDYRPDFMQATPSTWQMLVDEGWDNREQVTVLTGGEAINESLKNSLTDISETVWNLYGPTETTIWVTTQQLARTERVNIGRPLNNVSLYVLDNQHSLVPKGVTGELCIGGSQLAKGYLNRESLTEEKFIANLFAEGGRIYKTGDLARWLPDGSIELIGRKDSQVKIRGYRIELGEIENALSLTAGVQLSCVLASDDHNSNKRLVGYLVMDEELQQGEWKETVQDSLRNSLPEYMVPQLWVQLDEMPLTANGKLNRKALPDVDGSELSTKEYVAPRTELEEQLAKIWQDLLGVEKVGVFDNFFELGGHSLLATRLVSSIVKELKVDLMIRDIFHFVNIDDLSTYLEHKKIKEQESTDTVYKKTIKL